MAAVAHRAISGALARTEPCLLRFFRFPFDGSELCFLVRAIAERLFFRAPAGAPPVALAGFDIDRKRLASADFGRCTHCAAPPPDVASHASPQALASSRTRRM